jgi:FkbM family methyltransferase
MNARFKKLREPIRRLTPRVMRNWLRQPKRSIGYLADRLDYLWHGASEVAVRPDWRPRCHPASRNHFSVFATDLAQAAELNTFIGYCCPGMQFLDVGAHYGLFSLAAIRFGGPTARAVAVEPSPKARAVLRQNFVLNDVTAQVEIIEAAVGAANGTLPVLTTGPAGSDYFVSAPMNRTDTIRIPQRSLNTILRETDLRPTHMKLDIEGFESDALSGGAESLREFRPILFLELHGAYLKSRGHDPRDVILQLQECGYTRFEKQGQLLREEDFIACNFECRMTCLAS